MTEGYQQVSLGEEFLTAKREDVKPPASDDGRVDARGLKSAVGAEREPRPSPVQITVNAQEEVVEGHMAWLVARDERRPVRVVHKDYDKREYFKALADERADLSSAAKCAEAILPKAAIAGQDAQITVRDIAKTLKVSASQASRLSIREELTSKFGSYLVRGLKISHLEVVGVRKLTETRQRELLDRAVADNLSVRKFEKLVRAGKLGDRQIASEDRVYLEVLEEAGFPEELRTWNRDPERCARMAKKLIRVVETRHPELLSALPRGVKHGRAA